MWDLAELPLQSTGQSRSTYWAPLLYFLLCNANYEIVTSVFFTLSTGVIYVGQKQHFSTASQEQLFSFRPIRDVS